MKKRVIDIETLEFFESATKCAEAFGVSVACVSASILYCRKCKKRRFEYLDDWVLWPKEIKEKHTKKNNIYFL